MSYTPPIRLNRLSYKAGREQLAIDNGGKCGNVNVKGTNEYCAANTKDTNDGSEN